MCSVEASGPEHETEMKRLVTGGRCGAGTQRRTTGFEEWMEI